MIGKVFGFGKKSDYFLELDEAQGTGSAAPAKPVATQTAPVEAAVEAPAKKEEQPKKAQKKVSKKAQPAPKEAKEQAKATIEAISVSTPKEPPSLNNGLQTTPAGMTFAPDYLMSKPTSSRRRPGPSMNMFKDIARQVKPR